MKSFNLFLSIIILFSFVKTAPVFPVIAVLSLPLKEGIESVSATNLRWLQASGADVIAIHTWTPNEKIDELLSKVNGVMFQGYKEQIDITSTYYLTAKYIVNKLISLHNESKGETKIPLLAIGRDAHRLCSILLMDIEPTFLSDYTMHSPNQLVFNLPIAKESIIYSEIAEDDWENLSKMKLTVNYFNQAISKRTFDTDYNIKNNFNMISTSKNKDGKEYVSSFEGKKYPFIGLQYHPEAIVFEVNTEDIQIPDTAEAIKASRFIGNSFVFFARKNGRAMTLSEKLEYDFIDPYGPYPQMISKSYHYLFNQNKI